MNRNDARIRPARRFGAVRQARWASEGSAVENIRLIYEQIDTAKSHLLRGTSLDCRLALILLDNAAELLIHRALLDRFSFDDHFKRHERPGRLKYTAQERAAAQREFEPKLRIVGFRLGLISPSDRAVLKVCHRLRCEAFHAGTLRRTILAHAVSLLFRTTVGLTVRLPARFFALPAPTPAEEDSRFLQRFELQDAMILALDEGRADIANKLLEGVVLDRIAFADTLSGDLVQRIDEHIVGGLEYLADHRHAEIDRNLQYTQFWRDMGISLAESGVREPDLEDSFRQWKADGKAKYTLRRIHGWRRQAIAIARCGEPATAIDRWWAIDSRIQPLEADIGEAVAEFDDWVNAEIHSRRS